MQETGIGLGRKHAADPRDNDYLMPRKIAAAENVKRRIWTASETLDQLNTSHCVEYSTRQLARSSPVRQDIPLPFGEFYDRCQNVDEWPGSEKDPNPNLRYEGTSVRASMKVMKNELGLIERYEWAFRCEPVIVHILANGPVVLGTTWFMDMFTPDKHGYIYPDGAEAGGHAYLAIGADRERLNPDKTRGAVRIVNSWGPNWGPQKGRCWLTFNDLDTLVRYSGEAAVAIEKRA